MSRPKTIKCDMCQATTSPRWLIAEIDEIEYSVKIGSNLVHEPGVLDICSESCAMKLVSQTLGAGNAH